MCLSCTNKSPVTNSHTWTVICVRHFVKSKSTEVNTKRLYYNVSVFRNSLHPNTCRLLDAVANRLMETS